MLAGQPRHLGLEVLLELGPGREDPGRVRVGRGVRHHHCGSGAAAAVPVTHAKAGAGRNTLRTFLQRRFHILHSTTLDEKDLEGK